MAHDEMILEWYEKKLDEKNPDRSSRFDETLYECAECLGDAPRYFKEHIRHLIEDIEYYLPNDKSLEIIKRIVEKRDIERPVRLLFKQKKCPADLFLSDVVDKKGRPKYELTADSVLHPVFQSIGALLKPDDGLLDLRGRYFVKGCDGLPKKAYGAGFNGIFRVSPVYSSIPENYLDHYAMNGYYMYAFLYNEEDFLAAKIDDECKIFILLKICDVLEGFGYTIDKLVPFDTEVQNYIEE